MRHHDDHDHCKHLLSPSLRQANKTAKPLTSPTRNEHDYGIYRGEIFWVIHVQSTLVCGKIPTTCGERGKLDSVELSGINYPLEVGV